MPAPAPQPVAPAPAATEAVPPPQPVPLAAAPAPAPQPVASSAKALAFPTIVVEIRVEPAGTTSENTLRSPAIVELRVLTPSGAASGEPVVVVTPSLSSASAQASAAPARAMVSNSSDLVAEPVPSDPAGAVVSAPADTELPDAAGSRRPVQKPPVSFYHALFIDLLAEPAEPGVAVRDLYAQACEANYLPACSPVWQDPEDLDLDAVALLSADACKEGDRLGCALRDWLGDMGDPARIDALLHVACEDGYEPGCVATQDAGGR
jgi:hypothetical protein